MENIIKTANVAMYFKKIVSLLLALLFITSSLLTPFNLVYADDNGELIIKSMTHSKAKNIVIDGTKVKITLPYGYEAESVELKDIKYTNDSKFKLVELSFPSDSGSKALVDGPSVIMDVSYSYVDRADAKRYNTQYYIYVKRGSAPTFSGNISKTINIPKKIVFDDVDFTNIYKTNDGKDIGWISIGKASNSSLGTLIFGGNNYTSNTKISIRDIDLGKLVFEPLLKGTTEYTVTAYDKDERKYGSVKLSIKIDTPGAEVTKYSLVQDELFEFNLNDFVNACTKTVGGKLDYIIFPNIPSSSTGKLYIDYTSPDIYGTLIVAGKGYNKTNIPKMSFVPYSNYYGTFSIAYEGYNEAGNLFTGKIEITYTQKPIDADLIKYSTYENVPVNFISDNFALECKETTWKTLDYVKFKLPSKSRGRLYINYGSSSESRVSESTKYYRRDLDKITFVPYTDYRGTITISYVGYNDDGKSYTGEVEINVTRLVTDADDINYETGSYTPLNFDADDFVDECWEHTRNDLNYIKFAIPSSTYGVMYENYSSDTRYSSKVTSSAKYYERDLDDITFVPNTDYEGTFKILYTGYNSRDKFYTGAVEITVDEEIPVASAIKISTKEDTNITFDDEDFNKASKNATGKKLDYVRFSLPSTKNGKLYYKYITANKYDSAVATRTKYYYDRKPYLMNVTFVPYRDYHGTVNIDYTGYNVYGDSFTGTVKLKVISMPETEGSLYFKDVTKDYAWAASQIDYLFEQSIVNGTGNSNYRPEQNMTRGDFMLMLYRALDLSANTRGNFSDVPKDSYYYKAIATAKSLGIAKGYDNLFMPKEGITREDAMVLVDRALKTQGKKLSTGKDGDLKAFKDRNSVSDYAVTSVATLVKAGIIQGNNSNLNPESYISRSEMAVILYRVLEL
ncbi:S-layer homology domain-containing protein [Sedimentibacter sp. MB31-C6]|uniref:S-layer homology domain-containing protein n=1 Tax=Sedimentibacter sp. MB31-C6 TaxID=3109366 RepID=UPI002DDDB868|nr:S-layer homology domain-containing protein [Sedimentibacter sp. MB36-C1]WSI03667.1 S-layer homology domain-containing protein [Sedimentibacter sp. MB36-C1]